MSSLLVVITAGVIAVISILIVATTGTSLGSLSSCICLGLHGEEVGSKSVPGGSEGNVLVATHVHIDQVSSAEVVLTSSHEEVSCEAPLHVHAHIWSSPRVIVNDLVAKGVLAPLDGLTQAQRDALRWLWVWQVCLWGVLHLYLCVY